jgi:DNA-binding GntR family transcriptional regulator
MADAVGRESPRHPVNLAECLASNSIPEASLPKSLADNAYQQIKDWIVRYYLKPGARLHVKDLAQALGISQTPVREALSMLEREHLIEREPQKGFRVSALSMQEVEDLYDLRIALEVLAARQAAQRMTLSDRKRLSGLLREVGRLMKSGHKQGMLELEQDFHVIILEASGNKPLAEMGRAILDRIWIIQNINLLTTDHLTDVHPQHLRVFEAIKKGDPQKAGLLMARHLRFAKEFVISRLKRSDDILSNLMGVPYPDGPYRQRPFRAQGILPKKNARGRRISPRPRQT